MSKKTSKSSSKNKTKGCDDDEFDYLVDELNELDVGEEDFEGSEEEFENSREFQIQHENKIKEMDEYHDKLQFYFKIFKELKEYSDFYVLPIGDNLTINHIELLVNKVKNY